MQSLPPVVEDLDAARREHPDLVVADVRWYLDGRDGRAAYEEGHLPGAVFVDVDTDLAAVDRDPAEGRHPLPDPDAFALAMESAGIGDDTPVVAYDDTGGMTAGRLAVMLRMLGHAAGVLDGGLAAYAGPLERGPGGPVAPRRFTARGWPADRLADGEQTAAVAASPDGRLLDARAYDRFTGEVTLIDPRPGHIPGARSAPWTEVLDPTSTRFRTAHELSQHYAALGIDAHTEVVASCGSGVSACVHVLAMERAGLPPPRLFVASFSGWAAEPDRPVELGD